MATAAPTAHTVTAETLTPETLSEQTHGSACRESGRQSNASIPSYSELQLEVSALERRLAELQASEIRRNREKEQIANRFAQMLEILPGVILVLDDQGTILDCNSRAIEILNAPLLGCAWSVIVQREFCRGASRDGELKLKTGRWLSLARSPLDSEAGEMLLLSDITESRRTAELLQRSARLTCLGEMSARLGHQLRTPLAAALLYASRLDEIGTAEQQEAAGNISRRLRDLGCMVDDMLRFAAGTQQPGEFVLATELLHEVAETVAPQLTSGSQLKIDIADSGLKVLANREALKGALMNLITNAAQASDGSPVIELCAVQSRDQICLTVTDDGPGVRQDIRSRLFDPFFTTRPQGTGLGLAVVRSVAAAHGGEVMLDCGPHGTAFSICLPVATASSNGAVPEGQDVLND